VRSIVRPEPREEDEVVRRCEHVDVVDLHQALRVHRAAHLGEPRSSRTGLSESLRAQRHASGRLERDAIGLPHRSES
jgi:hypothetical protein